MREVFKEWKERFKGTKSVRVAIRYHVWETLRDTILKYKVKSVVEFGSGLSTIIFDKIGLDVTSFETNKEYMDQIVPLCSNKVKFIHWDGKEAILEGHFDMALVDGEMPRLPQAEYSKAHADIVVVDDYKGSSRGAHIFGDWDRVDDGSRNIATFVRPKGSTCP